MKNKKGWMKIVEAFTTVLLIAGFLLIVINQVNKTENNSQLVFDLEYGILREIQLKNDLRTSLLDLDPLPVEWDDSEFPQDVKDKINNRKPSFLSCEAKICIISDDCTSESVPTNEDVFVQSAIITSDLDTYSPRQIKLFCWNT